MILRSNHETTTSSLAPRKCSTRDAFVAPIARCSIRPIKTIPLLVGEESARTTLRLKPADCFGPFVPQLEMSGFKFSTLHDVSKFHELMLRQPPRYGTQRHWSVNSVQFFWSRHNRLTSDVQHRAQGTRLGFSREAKRFWNAFLVFHSQLEY